VVRIGKVGGQYDPHKVEDEVKRFWEEYNIYEKVKLKSNRSDKKFLFIDGPPYPSSDIPHIGTAWNKALKDVILRYKRLRGFNVHDQPGYDCHGLPIEVNIEKSLGIRSKREIETRVGVERFINLCKEMVSRNIVSLTRWFKDLGVFMDWKNPYLTMNDEYIESAWWLIKKASDMSLLVKEKRVVYWCPRCSTTLAEYEVEYVEITDPSIYVKFPIKGKNNEYLLIWTTTPWTLPANTFVMAHPDATYVRVRVGNEVYIIAKERVKEVMAEAGITEYQVIDEFKGLSIEGLEYEHPLKDYVKIQERLSKYHKVVMAPEFVVLHEGTGLVHAAPGHGFEDFTVARRLGIEEIASPVDDEGVFTDDAGKYKGLYVREANKVIIDDLRKRNALFHESAVRHRYPVCWRCKTPVILRATEQWVLKITKLKDRLVDEVKKAKWIPEWALDRIMAMLDNLQDWVLSRQRYWGTPLPIWVCPQGHKVVIGSVDELIKYGGKKPKELHRPWIDEVVIKCPYCGKPMRRVKDVIDVWFDSGIAFYASRAHPSRLGGDVVVDFITEGHDQTRGWFFSLLRAGVLGFNKVPYKVVLVHGFALDEQGREMHKSLGNYVGLDEVISKVGRDVFRFWVLQNTVWEDLKFSWKGLNEVKRDLSVAWNVFVFASTYMNLDNYDPVRDNLEKYVKYLRVEDRWILSRLNSLIERVTKAMDEYRVHDAARALREFIVEDASHWYVRIVRPRVWVEENTPDKLAVYATLYYILKNWLIMMSPFTPFLTEKLYQEFIRPAEPDAPVSIHLLEWPKVRREFIDESLEREMDVVRELFEVSAAARMKAKLKLRQPVKKVIIYSGDESIIRVVNKYRELLLNVLNCRDIEIRAPGEVKELIRYKVEPNYSVLGPKYKRLTKAIVEYLSSRGDDVARDILSKGFHEVRIGDVTIKLVGEDVKIIPLYASGYAVQEARWGSLVIDTRLSREEVAKGLARDIVRRIQTMRKELNLPMNAYIEVVIYVPETHRDYVKDEIDYIAGEVRAKEVRIVNTKELNVEGALTKVWDIQGEEYVIAIKQLK